MNTTGQSVAVKLHTSAAYLGLPAASHIALIDSKGLIIAMLDPDGRLGA